MFFKFFRRFLRILSISIKSQRGNGKEHYCLKSLVVKFSSSHEVKSTFPRLSIIFFSADANDQVLNALMRSQLALKIGIILISHHPTLLNITISYYNWYYYAQVKIMMMCCRKKKRLLLIISLLPYYYYYILSTHKNTLYLQQRK